MAEGYSQDNLVSITGIPKTTLAKVVISLNQQNFPLCSDHLLYLSVHLHLIFMIYMTHDTFSFMKSHKSEH